MNRYIFVSYSHQDQRTVRGIADRLERSGYSIWYDRDIQPGSLWDDMIKSKLKDSAVVLMFISRNFVRSDYCRLELKLALEQKKTIVPLYLDGTKFEEDLQQQIDRIQNISLSPRPTTNACRGCRNWIRSKSVSANSAPRRPAPTGSIIPTVPLSTALRSIPSKITRHTEMKSIFCA